MILGKIWQQKNITMPFTKRDMKKLLELCTKYAYFMFNIQQQNLFAKWFNCDGIILRMELEKNYDLLCKSILDTTISHINYRDQVNSWKNLWQLCNGPLCRNKSGPFLLNVATYWKSSNTEPCAKTTLIIGGGGLVSEFMWGIV